MTTDAVAYPPAGRVVVAVLTAVARVGALLILFVLLFVPDAQLDNPFALLRSFGAFCVMPGVAAWGLARVFAATVEVTDDLLLIAQRRQRVEVPRASVDRLVPWLIPLPTSGFRVRLRSGRTLGYGLHLAHSLDVLAALGDTDTARHPATVYGAAQQTWRRRWYGALLRFPLFALVPTLPLFRLHQWIAYGGTFGEYYTYGLQAYLLGFAIYWATTTVHLVLYATALRAVAEGIALGLTWLTPASARGIRRVVEWAWGLLYYGGVPALLAWRFLQS